MGKHERSSVAPLRAGAYARAPTRLRTSSSEYDTQLAFVDHELRNKESATGKAMAGITDPGQAAYIAAGYERPQGWKPGGSAGLINGWKNRLGFAQAAFNQYGQGGPVVASVARAAPAGLPPQQAPGNQVASADPNFVPSMPPQALPQQASVPAPNGQFPSAQELASFHQIGMPADGGPVAAAPPT